MASSSSTQPLPNWADLPPELIFSILLRLNTVEILETAQTCTSWRRVCLDPSIWHKIDMSNAGILGKDCDRMCRRVVDRAVDLTGGCLIEINLGFFGSYSLLSYIAKRASNLRCLRLHVCYSLSCRGFVCGVTELKFLEDLEISLGEPYELVKLKAIGRSCPHLKTLKLNRYSLKLKQEDINKYDNEALAIAETMLELRHLELYGNKLTNIGLKSILDNCLHLEYLDLGDCFNIKLVGDLEKQCSQRIKYMRRPDESFFGHFKYRDGE